MGRQAALGTILTAFRRTKIDKVQQSLQASSTWSEGALPTAKGAKKMKVLPYEHRGNMLSKTIVRSSDDILRLAEEFAEEEDKWIRKIIAQKLLDQEIEVLPEGLVRSLRDATHHKLL